MYQIENEELTVKVSPLGAELQSIYDKRMEKEVLWQGDKKYWGRRAPVLFPNVGRHSGDFYLWKGKRFDTKQHGFARDMEFTCVLEKDDELVFSLKDTEKTREYFPFAFELKIGYTLSGRALQVKWEVKNQGQETMYFTIGGHPAFRVPVLENTVQTDYKLLFKEKEGTEPKAQAGMTAGQWAAVGVLGLLTVSYFSGGFIGDGLRDLIINGVLEPMGKAKPKTIYQITHVMEGFEEMAIYWAGIFFIYFKAKKALGLDKAFIREMNRNVSAKDVWKAYPAVRYAGALIVLALFNNFVMIAAPTFPARATFSSSLMVMAAALAVLRIPVVQEAFAGHAGKVLRIGGGAVALFIAAATVWISYGVTVENDARIAYIETKKNTGEVVWVPPMGRENRALRHVFYKEFREEKPLDRGSGVAKFYGVKEIRSSRDVQLDPKYYE